MYTSNRYIENINQRINLAFFNGVFKMFGRARSRRQPYLECEVTATSAMTTAAAKRHWLKE